MTLRTIAAILAASTSAAALYAPAVRAQQGEPRYDIPAQDLAQALRRYSEISGKQVIAANRLVEGKRSTAVRGRLTAEAALLRLLAGTGLSIDLVEGTLVMRAGNGGAETEGAIEQPDGDIIVTGTRIRGTGPVGSPVAVIDRAAFERSGRAKRQARPDPTL